MTDSRNKLIQQLATDLQPVRLPLPPGRVGVLWWIGTWIFVAVVALLVAPLRPGSITELATHGQFFLESLIGFVAAGCLAVFVFRDSVPANGRRSALALGLILLAIWMLAYVVGLEYPAVEPSMVGKRTHCFIETLIYAVPPALAGIWLCRRYYPLAPLRTTALVTLVAAAVPALLMQVACMYEPAHILGYHILPIPLIVAAMTATHQLGIWLRPTRRR